jgi:hypothetical protein
MVSVLIVGDVVIVGRACMRNPPDSRAVCVEVYQLAGRPGYTLLFPNGYCDGFSPEDLVVFAVDLVTHDPQLAEYKFRSVNALVTDYARGVFVSVWQ